MLLCPLDKEKSPGFFRPRKARLLFNSCFQPDFPWTRNLFSPLKQWSILKLILFPLFALAARKLRPNVHPSSGRLLQHECCFFFLIFLPSYFFFKVCTLEKNFIALLISLLVTSHSFWQEASLQINTYIHGKWMSNNTIMRSGFLNFGDINIWSWLIHCRGGPSCAL